MATSFREACLQIVEKRGTIDGRFTQIRRIDPNGGNGTFSLLFSAVDRQTNCEAALKFYRPDKMGEAYRWQCFCREEEILKELVGQDDIIAWVSGLSSFEETADVHGVPFPIKFSYYAMELAVCDMEAALANANWSPMELLTAFRAMCRAVQRIHSHRISHRDLKPINFVLTRNSGVKLSDFGTARRFSQGDRPLLPGYNYPPGDWLYAAPEIVAGLHDVDPEFAFVAEFFSLGAILFEMFSGTKLGHHLAGQYLHDNLATHFSNVNVARRRTIYDQTVGAIADGYPLPRMGAQGPSVPPSIRDRLDDLYRQLAALDYRKRLIDFQGIFRRIDTCILILRYAEKYKAWRQQKERFREAREQKRQKRETALRGAVVKGVRT